MLRMLRNFATFSFPRNPPKQALKILETPWSTLLGQLHTTTPGTVDCPSSARPTTNVSVSGTSKQRICQTNGRTHAQQRDAVYPSDATVIAQLPSCGRTSQSRFPADRRSVSNLRHVRNVSMSCRSRVLDLRQHRSTRNNTV